MSENKLRAYDSKLLADNYALASQFEYKLEQLVKSNELQSVAQLPDSVIPSATLYSLIICYNVMYNLLCADHLIKDGHTKPLNTIH